MNCFVGCQSRLWVVTIVMYTCVFIPLRQLKRALATMLIGLVTLFSYETKGMTKETESPEIPSLTAARYEDLILKCHSCDGEREEICSICLVEFEGEDAVSKLGRCGHLFHRNCIQQWILRNHFSCPLCRSLLFSHHHLHTHNYK